MIPPSAALIAQVQSGTVLDSTATPLAVLAENIEPAWLILGFSAQAAILVCVGIHLAASHKRRKLVMPPSIGYVGLVATLMLMIYASLRHDVVFVAGQFINALICVRLLVLIRRAQEKLRQPASVDQKEEPSGFPIVSPDSVAGKLPRKEP